MKHDHNQLEDFALGGTTAESRASLAEIKIMHVKQPPVWWKEVRGGSNHVEKHREEHQQSAGERCKCNQTSRRGNVKEPSSIIPPFSAAVYSAAGEFVFL